jgi:hypothetical protein
MKFLPLLFLTLLEKPLVDAAGVVPGTGEFCSVYHAGATQSITCYDMGCDGYCGQCLSNWCPWECNGHDCGGSPEGGSFETYRFDCAAGCVQKKPCDPIPNARFTGSGSDRASCPFECDAGYLKKDRTCVKVIGKNGVIQVPGVGQYCLEYFIPKYPTGPPTYGGSYYLMVSDNCWQDNCDGTCGLCYNSPYQVCPWNCYEGCQGSYLNYYPQFEYTDYKFHCSSGCVAMANCAPVDNALFVAGDNCPFQCNAGYTKSGNACVKFACGSNQYLSNGVCTTCQPCGVGLYRKDCAGASEGSCAPCTNR